MTRYRYLRASWRHLDGMHITLALGAPSVGLGLALVALLGLGWGLLGGTP